MALVGVVLAGATLAYPLAFVADDSWFYLVIGRNIAHGHGITFSRVMPTNGFQPLWGLVVGAVLAVGRVLGVDSAVGEMRLVLLTGWGLLGLALWRLDRLLVRLAVPPAGVGLAALGVLAFLGGPLATVGSEANLVALLLVVAVSRTVAEASRTRFDARWSAGWGVTLGLVVLGRLDTGFVALAALAAVLLGGAAPRPDRLRATLVGGAAAAAVVGPYLLWNVVRFGHLNTIAGAIKLDRRELWFTRASLGWTGLALLTVALGAGALAFVGRRPARREVVAYAVPLAGGLASSAVYFAWSPGKLTDLDWYRIPQLLAAAVAAGLVVARASGWRPSFVRIAAPVAAGLLVLPLLAVQFDRRLWGANRDFWGPVATFSVDVGDRTPAGAVIASVDYPGVLAAYSGRRVVALDGLTGDYAFQDDLRDHGPCALARRGVTHLVVDDERRLDGDRPGTYRVELASWLHRVGAGELSIDRSDDLVFEDPATGLSLWRIHPRC